MIQSDYEPPIFFSNGHLQTLYPPIFRKISTVHYRRERIPTPDGDFLDLDWSCTGGEHLAIISHGLEGNSHRAYIKGMVHALNRNNWDALAWNCRSCSGVPNLKLRSYHNGVTDDLETVIRHAARVTQKKIALIGFSMGGNLTCLYLGRETVHPLVKKAVAISVPCDLKASADELKKSANALYMKRFLLMLHQKIKAKQKFFPRQLDDSGYHEIKDFKAFDDRYTAPIHGFENAEDYWKKCSCKPFLDNIRTPTLMFNAANDPFLPGPCYPKTEAARNPYFTLLIPESGGHVGFVDFNDTGIFWSEKKTIEFLNQKDTGC